MLIEFAKWFTALAVLLAIASIVPQPRQGLVGVAMWVCGGLVAVCLLIDAFM